MSKNKELQQKLLEAFIGEAHEQLQKVVDGLINLESITDAREKQEQIEGIYRELHNLKGSARGVKFTNIEKICHPLESVLYAFKTQKLKPEPALVDLILAAARSIPPLFEASSRETLPSEIEGVLAQIERVLQNNPVEELLEQEADAVVDSVMILPENDVVVDKKRPSSPGKDASDADSRKSETLRISATRLDQLLQKSDELLSVKAIASQQAVDARSLQMAVAEWAKSWAKAVPEVRQSLRAAAVDPARLPKSVARIDEFINKNSELLRKFTLETQALAKTSNSYAHTSAVTFDLLMEETKQLLMMPCSGIFDGLPILVRDLARHLKKEVTLTIHGGDVELDKRVLKKIRDPLIHIIRNSIDHGIETPKERLLKGKPERGTILVSVEQLDAKNISITVLDDGRGIDLEKVKSAALEAGLYSFEELSAMSADKVRSLIFESSLSTSATITEISGRGIGMSIVEENVQQIGGKIKVENGEVAGTKCTITLPVTLATFRGLLVESNNEVFVLPTASVERVVRVKREELQVLNGIDVISIEDTLLPISLMETILALSESVEIGDRDYLTVCIIAAGSARTAIVVDEVLEEQEVLVKPLGKILSGTRNVSGLTILGSGVVVPILNAVDLLNHKQNRRSTQKDSTLKAPAAKKRSQHRILVADDTITARLLLGNLLESAGYVVEVAKDGRDAFSKLKRSNFSIAITDVEMPNMDGFQLTAAIRDDAELKHLPVVIVTSKASNADREKGVKAGADAYFVKGNLEGSNILEVIGSLI